MVAGFIATARGPGLTADSITYISSGLNLADGNGLHLYNGDSLTLFPPGLPITVAVGHWLGISSDWTVRVLNVGAFAASVWLGYVLLRRHVSSNLLIATSTVVLAVSMLLLSVVNVAGTEPVFIVTCLGVILILERFIAEPRGAAWLFGAAALVWIAFLFRYAGLALIPAGTLALLLGLQRRGWRNALMAAIGFAALSIVGPVVWIARNHNIDGRLMGPRASSSDGLFIIAKRSVATVGGWIFPSPTPEWVKGFAGIIVVLGASALFLWFRANRKQRGVVMSEHSVPSLVPLVTFVAVYYVYLVGAQLSTTIAPIGNRYLAPVYVPLVVIGAAAASRLVVPVRERLSRRTSLIARLLLALVVVGQAVVFVAEVQTSASNGVGFAAQSWQRSQLADVVRDVSPDARLYSNVPDGLWAVLQREPLYLSPLKRVGFSNDAVAISPDFPKDIECDVSYLAWFTRNPRPYLYSRSELKQVAQLVVVSKVADGTLYRLEPRSITPAGEACRGPSGNRSA